MLKISCLLIVMNDALYGYNPKQRERNICTKWHSARRGKFTFFRPSLLKSFVIRFDWGEMIMGGEIGIGARRRILNSNRADPNPAQKMNNFCFNIKHSKLLFRQEVIQVVLIGCDR